MLAQVPRRRERPTRRTGAERGRSTTHPLDRRYPREVESAVYFCCREALQNVAKHAEGATHVTIRVVGDDRRLSFAIRDDGAGSTWSARTPAPAS